MSSEVPRPIARPVQGPTRGPVGPSGQARARTGADELADAIRASRGLNAPRRPVTLCGTPPTDGTPVFRVGDPMHFEGSGSAPFRTRLAEAIVCPGCFALRFGPTHLAIRLLVGKH